MIIDKLCSFKGHGDHIVGGTGDGNPGVMGAGGLREAEEEGAGGGISKRGRSQEKWEKFHNVGMIFCNRKSTRRWGPLRKGAGTRSTGCGRREVQIPLSPPHIYTSEGSQFWLCVLRVLQSSLQRSRLSWYTLIMKTS